MRRFVMWILALVANCPTHPQAHDGERLSVVVRLYASGEASPAPSRALSVATTILGEAGVDVTWTSCGSESHIEPACHSRPTSTDLLLRMIRYHDDSNSPSHALGYALIDRQQHTGALATIYVDRVASLARESGVDGSVLLGRAIAHEIGHLLMGTNQHSTSGVMRATWTSRDLLRERPDHWRFTPAEMMAMRGRVEAGSMISKNGP
jgi:hypothetical protein